MLLRTQDCHICQDSAWRYLKKWQNESQGLLRELIAGQSRKRELDAEEAIVVNRKNVKLQRESLSKSFKLSSHSCQIDKLMDEIELIENSTSITINTDKLLSKNDNLKMRIGYIIKLRLNLIC